MLCILCQGCDETGTQGTWEAAVCQQPPCTRLSVPRSLPWLSSQRTSVPQLARRSLLAQPEDGEPEIYVLRGFYVLSRRLRRENFAARKSLHLRVYLSMLGRLFILFLGGNYTGIVA